jgi:hypothetical protein
VASDVDEDEEEEPSELSFWANSKATDHSLHFDSAQFSLFVCLLIPQTKLTQRENNVMGR